MKKLLALLAFCATVAFSQAVTSAPMSGTVTDPQGGVVVGAQIVVTNSNNGQAFNATTDESGHWVLPAMQQGLYRVVITMAGFRTSAVSEVKVDTGTPATVNAKLEIGQVTETVDVSSGAELVQATTATVNSTLEGRQVFELPAITRGGLDLLVSQPGVQTSGNNRNSSINGLPNGAINVTLDGISTQDQNTKSSNGFFTFLPITQDSIEEVTLTTSAAGADSTGEGAAQIKFVTKSGTNNLHGGAFWQVRNTYFNANSYFNNINGQPRDIIKLNQGGVHAGGPIVKNKLFIFANYEQRWLPGSKAYSRAILTPEATRGDYVYADSGGNKHTVNVLALANQAGYSNTVDPIIAKTLSQIQGYAANGRLTPLQTTCSYCENSLNYTVSGTDQRKYFTTRIDYNLNDKNTLGLTYTYNVYNSVPDTLNNIVPVFPGTGVIVGQDGLAGGQTSNRFGGTLALRTSISSRLTNELRGGLNSGSTIFGSTLGSSALYSQWRGYIPTLPLGLSGVTSYGASSRRNSPVKQINDTLSYLLDKHTVSFGGNFTQVNLWSQSSNNSVLPTITIGIDSLALDPVHNGQTGQDAFIAGVSMPGASSADANNAANLYALLTGRVSAIGGSVNQSETSHTYAHDPKVDRTQQREWGLFVQDSWRLLPNLTVSLGVRYEHQGPLTDLTGNYTNVDIASIWGASGIGNMFKPGTLTGVHPTFSKLTEAYRAPSMWSPSAGIAWQIPQGSGLAGLLFGRRTGETVIRAGYAINTIRYGTGIMSAMYGSNPGNNYDISIDSDNYPQQFGPAGSVLFSQANLPAYRSAPTAPVYPFSPNPTDSLNAFDPKLKIAYVQSWNIGIQRQIGKTSVLEVRYTGNHGVHEWRQVSLNEVNIFENGFLDEMNAATKNLTIARGGNIAAANTNNFGYQGLPGQVHLPILETALGSNCCNNATYANYLRRNQPYAMAAQIYTTASRMANLTKAGYPANMFVVNPDVPSGNSYLVNNMGSSYYDALQVEWRRRLAGGVLAQASYVWSKSLVNGNFNTDDLYNEPQTFRNVGLSKQPIGFDMRHAFKVNAIYEFPLGPGRRFLNKGSRFARKALEGWEITGQARNQSGTPWQVSANSTGMNNQDNGVVLQNMTTKQLQDMVSIYKTTLPGTSSTSPVGAVYWLPQDLIANTNAAWEGNGKSWANLDASKPYVSRQLAPGQFGYRVFLYGPWQNKFDALLLKRTSITEKVNVEFKVQAINVFNLTNFYLNSSTTISSTSSLSPSTAAFGRTTAAYADLANAQDPGSRVIDFSLRINF